MVYSSDEDSLASKKKNILKEQNNKSKFKEDTKSYDTDFTEFDDDKNKKINTKKTYDFDASSAGGIKKKPPVKQRSPSPSRSKSSRSRSRSPKTDKKRPRSYSPTISPSQSASTITKFKGGASNKFKAYQRSGNSKASSRRSSESVPAPYGRVKAKNFSKTKTKLHDASNIVVENPSKIAARVISAQRIKNNELENKLTELSAEMEKLYTENKTLKRMQKRDEVALKKMEDNDVDVNRLIRNYTDEISSYKAKLKKNHEENKRLNATLIEREEELRVNKKKYGELKDILNDKKLLDSAELAKKLEKAERDLDEYKSKCEILEKKLELSEKNHKHEIGVEIAHHKETKKNLQKVSQELNEAKVKLEEKERAIDALNIYTRANRDANAGSVPPWKMSTGSLNNLNTLNDNVLEKRKEYDRKVKEKNRNSKLSESDRRKFDGNDEVATLTNRSEKTTHRSEKNLDFEKQRLFEMERQRQEQEAELRKKDDERIKRQQQEREERDRLEKMRMEAERKRELHEKENAEKKMKEKQALEELERKKRWTSSNETTEDLSSNKKKEDLLAKLFSANNNDDDNESGQKTFITAVAQPLHKPVTSIFDSKPPLPNSNNNNNSNSSSNNINNNNKISSNANNKDLDLFGKTSNSNNKENVSKDLFGDSGNESNSKDLFANVNINSKNSKPAFGAKNNSNKNLFSSNNNNATSNKNLFDDIPTLGSTTNKTANNNSSTSPPSNSNSGGKMKFNKSVENLHEGKPASAPRSENDDDLSDTKSAKGDLLNKLFGSSNAPSNNNTTNKSNNFLQSKLDDIENFSFNNKNAKNDKEFNTQGSRVPYLPWDIPEATVDKKPPINTKKTSLFDDDFDSPSPSNNNNNSKLNGTLKRPKENNLFFTSNKNMNANNQSYVEDIEELAL